MTNLAMQRMLAAGEALDVNKEGEKIGEGLWRLRRFVEGKDYCDASAERWVWSIGSRLEEGRHSAEILASTTTQFYQHPKFECLFLR